MNNNNYPFFLIGCENGTHFVVCFDKEFAFVARVIPFLNYDLINEFIVQRGNIQDGESASCYYKFKNREGGIVLLIEDFFYYFDWTDKNKLKIKSLLKKALKKYLHYESDRTPHGDLNIDNQILQQELTVKLAKDNYNDLLIRAEGDKEYADYTIALAEATLESLKRLRDNRLFIGIGMN